ncbi:MAG TPA: cupin domain-containing protein [Acidobacteria bacterium]|nr:cupin domain-containing protein [Acidobacteriota bacterium]
MIEERDGWLVVNVRDARWYESQAFGKVCSFEDPSQPFPETGVRLFLLEPGKPNCRYHRESAQEDLLVLSGQCRLLVNDQERLLEPWDYVHLPPGVSHVLVGTGQGPCAVLMIGHRPENHQLFYPASEVARRHGAEAPQPTADPRVAYSDVAPRVAIEAPEWPR